MNNQSTRKHTLINKVFVHQNACICVLVCVCVCVSVVLCLCVSFPRTVNKEIKDERVLWSSPPLAAQSGVLAKFPLWCRCGARLSFFHIDTETAADSVEVGVLSLSAGRSPAICHAKLGTFRKGPEGSGGSKVSCPFFSSAFPLFLSRGISRSYQAPSRRPSGTSLTSCFWRWWGGRRWTGGMVRRPHTHLLWECPGGNAEQTARRRPLSRSQLSPSKRGRDLPVHTAHAVFAGKSLTQQKRVCVSMYLFTFKLYHNHAMPDLTGSVK